MNWEAVGSIAELVGALAVLATLAYLARQIGQNTLAMEESRKVELARSRTETTRLRVEWLLTEAASPEITPILNKLAQHGYPKPESIDCLTDEERGIVYRLQAVNRLINENGQYQYELGVIDEDAFRHYRRNIDRWKPLWKKIGVPSTLGGDDT